MDRNCDKCIHHTSGPCSSWDCKMQTVEGLAKETRAKAIEEFAEKMKELFKHIKVADSVIDMVVKEMKGEQP